MPLPKTVAKDRCAGRAASNAKAVMCHLLKMPNKSMGRKPPQSREYYSPKMRVAASFSASSTVAAPDVILAKAGPIAPQNAPISGLDGIGIPIDAFAIVALTLGSVCAAPAVLSVKAPKALVVFQVAKPSSVRI